MSLLLTTNTFVIEVVIDAAPSKVLAFLADLPAFFRLNPLVVAVEPVRGEPDTYHVVDRLHVFGVPYHLRYKVRSVLVQDGVDSEVWSALSTHLRNTLRVLPEGPKARVRETVQMTALRPLARMGLETARTVHRELYDHLK